MIGRTCRHSNLLDARDLGNPRFSFLAIFGVNKLILLRRNGDSNISDKKITGIINITV